MRSCDLVSALFGMNVCSTCCCSSVRMFVLLNCGRVRFRMLGLPSALVVCLCCWRASSEVLEVETIVCVIFFVGFWWGNGCLVLFLVPCCV